MRRTPAARIASSTVKVPSSVLLEVARRVLAGRSGRRRSRPSGRRCRSRPSPRAGRRRRARRPRRPRRAARLDALEEAPLAGGEVVVDDDLDPVGEQPVGEVAADEAGAACDERAAHPPQLSAQTPPSRLGLHFVRRRATSARVRVDSRSACQADQPSREDPTITVIT